MSRRCSVTGDSSLRPARSSLCPFESANCTKGVRRLNRFGGISQMYTHWKRVHGDNDAAKQRIARFKIALKNKRLTADQLVERAPVEQGEAEDSYEQMRSPDVVASENMFTYPFEMLSDEHRTWLEATGTM